MTDREDLFDARRLDFTAARPVTRDDLRRDTLRPGDTASPGGGGRSSVGSAPGPVPGWGGFAEMREIRRTLRGVARGVWDDGTACWCDGPVYSYDRRHSFACERARELDATLAAAIGRMVR